MRRKVSQQVSSSKLSVNSGSKTSTPSTVDISHVRPRTDSQTSLGDKLSRGGLTGPTPSSVSRDSARKSSSGKPEPFSLPASPPLTSHMDLLQPPSSPLLKSGGSTTILLHSAANIPTEPESIHPHTAIRRQQQVSKQISIDNNRYPNSYPYTTTGIQTDIRRQQQVSKQLSIDNTYPNSYP